jgi:hypothetical protein
MVVESGDEEGERAKASGDWPRNTKALGVARGLRLIRTPT